MALSIAEPEVQTPALEYMDAYVFHSPGEYGLQQRLIPVPEDDEAVVKVRVTSICDADVRIAKGEFPAKRGVILGHGAVGTISRLGKHVHNYEIGQRVLVSAVTPCGECESCMRGYTSDCGGPLGNWRLGNTIDGTHAEYVLVPAARINLTPVPDEVRDEEIVLLADVASVALRASEAANVQLGDVVAIFAEGSLGLCGAIGAKLRGAAQVFVIDSEPHRLQAAPLFGATHAFAASAHPVELIMRSTKGRGVDVSISTLDAHKNTEDALRVLRRRGTLSLVGGYCGHLRVSLDGFGSPYADQTIVSSLCPGGKERMARLIRLVQAKRMNLAPLLTNTFELGRIREAYDLVAQRRSDVLNVAVRVA